MAAILLIFISTNIHAQTFLKNNLYAGDVEMLAVSPAHADELFAINKDDIFHSIDNGKNWQSINFSAVTGNKANRLVINPSRADEIFVASSDGVYKSNDDGKTWSKCNHGLPQGLVTAIAINPNNPDEIYAAIERGSLYKSSNGGKTWKIKSNGLGALTIDAIAINPFQSKQLIVSSYDEVARSDDAGAHWYFINNIPSKYNSLLSHVSDFIFSPNDTLIYAVADDGLFVKENAASKWVDISPIKISSDKPMQLGLLLDSTNPAILYACGDGVYQSLDKGKTWSKIAKTYGNALFADKKDAHSFFMISANAQGVYHSTDTGMTWQPIASGLLIQTPINVLAVDPVNPNIVYAGTQNHGIWKTEDGISWQFISENLPSDFGVGSIAINPLNSNNIIVGKTYNRNKSTIGYISWDAGKSWELNNIDLADHHVLDFYVKKIIFNPINPSEIWALLDVAGLVKTNDGGKNWQKIVAADSIRNFQVNSFNPTELFLYSISDFNGLAAGEYQSINDGEAWQAMGPDEVRFDSFDSTIMYKYVASTSVQTLMRSLDHGTTWESLKDFRPKNYNNSINFPITDPQNSNNLSIITTYFDKVIKFVIYTSLNKGVDWQSLEIDNSVQTYWYADKAIFTGNRIYIPASDGVYSLNINKGI